MIKALNHITVFGWKIRANVARFVKVVKKTPNQKKVWAEKRREPVNPGDNKGWEIPRNGHLKHGLSWADVAAGKKAQHEDEIGLNFANESSIFTKWRGRSIIGELQSIESLREVSMMKKQLCLMDSQVRYVGGLKLLIIFETTESLEETMRKNGELWKNWIKSWEIWNGQFIPFERIAWLRISGVPLQIWIDEVFNCIGEKFGRVIKSSEADDKDLCLNEDTIGVIVNYGSMINEKITIRWKHLLYEIWVSEINQLWLPEFVNELDSKNILTMAQLFPISSTSQKENSQPETKDTAMVDQEELPQAPENERTGNESVEVKQAGNEKTADEQSEGGHALDEETPINESCDAAVEEPQLSEEQTNKGGPQKKGEHQINNLNSTVGPDITTQKKRKRINLAEANSNCLKPQTVVGKGKLPDLNIELSDDSRSRPKKKLLLKRGKTKRIRNRVRIRLSEEDINNFDYNNNSLDDDLNSEWEEEVYTDNQKEVSTVEVNEDGTENSSNELNEQEVASEVKATLEIGTKIGVELHRHEALVKTMVTEDQVEARNQ
ncbi:hypothetical protein Hanom_Chr05g00453281 [Helianthus anomalus]